MVSHPINWTTKWWAGALDVSSQHSQTIQTTVEVWNCACGGKWTKEQKISVHTSRPSRGRAATRLCAKFNAGTNISTRNCGIIWFGRNYFKRLVAQTKRPFPSSITFKTLHRWRISDPAPALSDVIYQDTHQPHRPLLSLSLRWSENNIHNISNTENRPKYFGMKQTF